jgi:hypothetical protein
MTSNETPHSSPKRKRDTRDSASTGEVPAPSPKAPRLNTSILRVPLEEVNTSDGSPRSKVADKLEGLHLRGDAVSRTLVFRSEEVKLPDEVKVGGALDMGNQAATNQLDGLEEEVRVKDQSKELHEQGPRLPSNEGSATALQPKRHAAHLPVSILPEESQSSDSRSTRTSRPRARRTSPPASISRTAQPDVAIEDSNYWQEGEITGATAGLDDSDDDLEGLNGIGFKPSPAESEARAMRRKQQILDYKSREAKEARQKRSERRRRADEAFVETERARKVKFAIENA